MIVHTLNDLLLRFTSKLIRDCHEEARRNGLGTERELSYLAWELALRVEELEEKVDA